MLINGPDRIGNEFSTILGYIIGPLQKLPSGLINREGNGLSAKWMAEVERK
jgi:hypothetical protein